MKKTLVLFFCTSSLVIHASHRDYYALSTANQSVVDACERDHFSPTKKGRKGSLSSRHVATQMRTAQPKQQAAKPEKFVTEKKSPFDITSPDIHQPLGTSDSFKVPTPNVPAVLKAGRVRLHSEFTKQQATKTNRHSTSTLHANFALLSIASMIAPKN